MRSIRRVNVTLIVALATAALSCTDHRDVHTVVPSDAGAADALAPLNLQQAALVVGSMAFNESENAGTLPQPARFRIRDLTMTNAGGIAAQVELLAPTTTETALPLMADFFFWQVTMNWADNQGNIRHEPASDMNAIPVPRPAVAGTTVTLDGKFVWDPSLHTALPLTVSVDVTWVRAYGFGRPKAFHVWPGIASRERAGDTRVGSHHPSIDGSFFTYPSIEASHTKGGDFDYRGFINAWFAGIPGVEQCALADAATCASEAGCATVTGTSWNADRQCQVRVLGCSSPACGAAETRGIGPDGSCVHFPSTCQPRGFSRVESCPFEPVGASPLSCAP